MQPNCNSNDFKSDGIDSPFKEGKINNLDLKSKTHCLLSRKILLNTKTEQGENKRIRKEIMERVSIRGK